MRFVRRASMRRFLYARVCGATVRTMRPFSVHTHSIPREWLYTRKVNYICNISTSRLLFGGRGRVHNVCGPCVHSKVRAEVRANTSATFRSGADLSERAFCWRFGCRCRSDLCLFRNQFCTWVCNHVLGKHHNKLCQLCNCW